MTRPGNDRTLTDKKCNGDTKDSNKKELENSFLASFSSEHAIQNLMKVEFQVQCKFLKKDLKAGK